SFCLEDAAHVRGSDRERCSVEMVRHRHFRAALAQTPPLDKALEMLPIQPVAPAVEGRIDSRDDTLVPVSAWEHSLNGVENPLALVFVHRHCFDRERSVGALLILSNEAVALQPAGKSSFCYVKPGHSADGKVFGPMPRE